jgi:hypothetical protein
MKNPTKAIYHGHRDTELKKKGNGRNKMNRSFQENYSIRVLCAPAVNYYQNLKAFV